MTKQNQDRWVASVAALVLAVTIAAGAQTPSAPEPPAFRLSPGDVIELKFFYNPELNDLIQIRPDGRLSLQLVGEVLISGRTVAEASAELESRYRPFLKSPSITIQVRTYGSQKVYVAGEVVRPGAIPLVGELTVLDAIMESGGARLTGDTSSVILIRKGVDGLPAAQKVSLRLGGQGPSAAAATLLRPFDVILVPETKIARVDRWVDQHIRQVIPFALSGGFSYLLNATRIDTPIIISQ